MDSGINLLAIFIADGFGICLSLIMIGAAAWHSSKQKNEKLIIILMLITTILSCAMDSISFAFDGKPGIWAKIAVYVSNFWLYASNMIMGTLWLTIVLSHVTGKPFTKSQLIASSILNGIGVIVLLINFFVPIAFSVNEQNVYSRGPLYLIFMAIEVIFMADGLLAYIIQRRKDRAVKVFPIWEFIIPVVVGIVVQLFVYGISTIWPSIAISICGIMFGIFNENEAELNLLRQHEEDSKTILEQGEALKAAVEEAEKANNAKTEFLFNMSHDIRTPMNAILGYADVALRHDDEPERVEDSLLKIKTAGAHLLNLINDILEMSRIESGKLEIAEIPVDINKAIDGIATMSETLAVSKSINFQVIKGNIKNPYILGDELHINQVLINLISNAVKYNNEGGKVMFRFDQLSDPIGEYASYRFIIEDNGIGMSEEFQEHLFESFAREKRASVSKQEGAGLGLSIVKRIVDLCHGTIRVESKPGVGTKFTINLSFKVMNEEEIKTLQTSQENYTTNDTETLFKNKRVLVVEDNEMNREIASDILTDSGFIIETAEDGAIALNKVKEKGIEYYDYILMDIQMPVMNGYEATKAIRELPDGDKAIIIALSANAFKEDVDKSLEAGMNAHVSKPVNIKKLLDTMLKVTK